LAHALQVNTQWLAHGKGPMEASMAPPSAPLGLSPEALKVAQNWSKLSPEVGKKIADMLEEMVKASSTDPSPNGEPVGPGKRRRAT
jgi:hypothetical protein